MVGAAGGARRCAMGCDAGGADATDAAGGGATGGTAGAGGAEAVTVGRAGGAAAAGTSTGTGGALGLGAAAGFSVTGGAGRTDGAGVAGAATGAGGAGGAAGAVGFAAAGTTTGLGATGGTAGLGGGAAAASFFCVIARRTSPGREMCDRSILVLISSSPRSGRPAREDEVCASDEPRMWTRTFSASCSSRELECVFFSVTPTSGSVSRIALLLTSSSLARSLIRTLLIRPFCSPALC